MELGFLILGGLCLIYFLILCCVSMDFSIVWLAAAVCFVCAAMIHHFFWKGVPTGAKLAVGGICGLFVLIFLICEGMIISGMINSCNEKLDVVIVLGAQIHGDTPSRALNLRLEAAEKAWETCGEPILILSGGQGDGETITEAECMKRVLLKRGIPENRLILEDQSANTEENLRFSDRKLGIKEKRVGIVSNNFHIYRALRLAKKQGYSNVYGIPGKSDWRYQIHYMVREAFALVKEVLVGNI